MFNGPPSMTRPSGSTFTFAHQLTLQSVSPPLGSLVGGTNLTVVGDGFGPKPPDVEFTLGLLLGARPPVSPLQIKVGGHGDCMISAASTRSMHCETPRADGSRPLRVNLTAVAHYVPESARGDTFLGFEYSVARTPLLLPYFAASRDGATWSFLFEGAGFGDVTEAIRVWVGVSPCNTSKLNDTAIACTTGPLSTGNHTVHLHREGWGYAEGWPQLPVQSVEFELDGLARAMEPSSIDGGTSMDDEASLLYDGGRNISSPEPLGSMAGDLLLRLNGSGFSLLAMELSVRHPCLGMGGVPNGSLCVSPCTVEPGSLRAGSVLCRVPPMLLPTMIPAPTISSSVQVTDGADDGSFHVVAESPRMKCRQPTSRASCHLTSHA